jgi:hypothetical protein
MNFSKAEPNYYVIYRLWNPQYGYVAASALSLLRGQSPLTKLATKARRRCSKATLCSAAFITR